MLISAVGVSFATARKLEPKLSALIQRLALLGKHR